MGGQKSRKDQVRQKPGPAMVAAVVSMQLAEFGEAARQGIFERVVMESDWTHFRVRGEMANGVTGMVSLTKEDRPRRFLNPASVLVQLRKMGVTRVEVVMGEWDVEMAVLSMRQRPDVTARRLRRSRMTYAEQVLEDSKKNPELAVFVPPGTREPGPVSREEELMRLVAGKYEEMQRKAEGAQKPVKERTKSRVEREREVDEERRRSDALHDEVMRMAQESLRGWSGGGEGEADSLRE